MSIRVLVLAFVSLLAAGLAPAHAQLLPIPPGWQMERTVLLSRYGVRAPLQSKEEMDRHVATPWPTWPVAPGELTPHGAQLMQLMGRYYRVLFGGRGLIQSDDCPPLGAVAVWTDTDQRTRQTGIALLSGMYPRCATVSERSQTNPSVPDPLFHPQPSASCPMNADANRTAILARIGGDFSSVLREYAPQLNLMQATLCPPGLNSSGRYCGLPSEPPSIQTGPDGRVTISGPIGIGSAAAEAFVLEDANGLPADQVAWGRLQGEAQIQDLLEIHRLEIDLAEKTLPIARQRGSNLLSQITATLQDGHNFPGMPRVAEPVRLAILVSHDNNLANIARLLNVGWRIEGFQPNELSPGGALAFELLRDVRIGRRYVRLAFYGQTVAQMRNLTPLTFAQPPGMTAVDLPDCDPYLIDKACPIERFVEIARAALDPDCVTTPRN